MKDLEGVSVSPPAAFVTSHSQGRVGRWGLDTAVTTQWVESGKPKAGDSSFQTSQCPSLPLSLSFRPSFSPVLLPPSLPEDKTASKLHEDGTKSRRKLSFLLIIFPSGDDYCRHGIGVEME